MTFHDSFTDRSAFAGAPPVVAKVVWVPLSIHRYQRLHCFLCGLWTADASRHQRILHKGKISHGHSSFFEP